MDYIRGMFDVMSSQYTGQEEMKLSDAFKYPKQIEYESSHDYLSDRCKQLRLKHLWELQEIDSETLQIGTMHSSY